MNWLVNIMKTFVGGLADLSPGCKSYGKQVTFLRNAAHEHPDEMAEPVPKKLSAEARERIRQKLRANRE